ncbi:MAG: nucleoside-diphosphate kinase [Patescibacteria group bacterium]|jgi:nucleoside-diphosphate kinase
MAVYGSYADQDFFLGLKDFLLSGEVYAYVVIGKDAINVLNAIVGNTDPEKAAVSTIRRRFGESIRRNITHSTKDEVTFFNELRALFTQEEIAKIESRLLAGTTLVAQAV